MSLLLTWLSQDGCVQRAHLQRCDELILKDLEHIERDVKSIRILSNAVISPTGDSTVSSDNGGPNLTGRKKLNLITKKQQDNLLGKFQYPTSINNTIKCSQLLK